MIKKGGVVTNLILLLLLVVPWLMLADQPVDCLPACGYYNEPFGNSPREGVRNFLYNMGLVVKEAVSLDTMLILTGFTPLYLSARMLDEEVHRGFYDSRSHKNLDYPKRCLEWTTHGSMVLPILGLSGLMQFSSNPRVRMTGAIAMSGITVTQITNQLIKHIAALQPLRAGARPRNEYFCPHRRVYNGFPSGHTMGCAYITVLCGLQLGARWAIPVGTVCGVISGLTIQCNRHYLSQVVAGIAVGTVFAVASSKVVEAKLSGRYAWCKNVEFVAETDQRKRPSLRLSYLF
ncbi:hypothetical protein A3F06_03165 [candidate division TM6 bacterium RIFCSPHIGHO2_12_FULL_36_22]|nr:MAG: hypothetical protein A3F06_03165 [candidate division TM6 bacterium RIFCSPHIGHO2_12_FULL_36_22]